MGTADDLDRIASIAASMAPTVGEPAVLTVNEAATLTLTDFYDDPDADLDALNVTIHLGENADDDAVTVSSNGDNVIEVTATHAFVPYNESSRTLTLSATVEDEDFAKAT